MRTDPLPILTVHEDLDRVTALLAQPILDVKVDMEGVTASQCLELLKMNSHRCYIIGLNRGSKMDGRMKQCETNEKN